MKIVAFITHERFHWSWIDKRHEYFLLPSAERPSGWRTEVSSVPPNVHLIDSPNEIPSDCDVLVTFTAFGQRIRGRSIREMLPNIGWIEAELCLPFPSWNASYIAEISQSCSADLKVFKLGYQADAWGVDIFPPRWGSVTYDICGYAMDTDIFCDSKLVRKPYLLTVADDFPERDVLLGYAFWKAVTGSLPADKKIILGTGGTKAIGGIFAKDINELVRYYQEAACFINTAPWSTIPTSLLEAMATSTPIVSVDAPYISDGMRSSFAYVGSNIFAMRKAILKALSFPSGVSQNRQVCQDEFPLQEFRDKWNKLYWRVM